MTRGARPSLLFPILLVSFSPLGIDLLLPAASAMTEAFARAPERAGLLVSAFLLPLGLGQIPFGRLSDVRGRREVALLGLGLFGLGALGGALAGNWGTLLACRSLQGLGASATTVCAFAAMRDRSEAGAPGGFAVLTAVLNIITALAPVLSLAPLLLLGWRAVFWLYVFLAVAAYLFVASRMSKHRPMTRQAPLALGALLRQRSAWAPASITVLAMIFLMGHVALAPVVLMDRLGLSEFAFGALFTLNAAVVVLASATVSPLALRLGTPGLIRLGLALLVVAGLVLLATGFFGASSALPYICAVSLGSVGFSYCYGPAQGLTLAPFGDSVGASSGVLGALQLCLAAATSALLSSMGARRTIFGGALAGLALLLGLAITKARNTAPHCRARA